ncbi:tetratricopeptide repeat-containing diguanylate cyclase [Alteromonas oceanisediminis]|uniref:tetratricopeptide repeat-containing diguanylate cyclase n=1 Tax=Alteromonas oceanisediminis TaxID=2836180 RepID=UPI001BD9A926|nr:diguanylate cyclase [Alteromonas oceanisediminis]MBT0585508.1 GGDEF domain-containing protein [Alteromonas oceanisediminis]
MATSFAQHVFAQNASSLIDVMSPKGYEQYTRIMSLQDEGLYSQVQAEALTLLNDARLREHSIDEAAAQRLIGLAAMERNQHDFAHQAFSQAAETVAQAEEFLLLAQINSDIGRNYRYQSDYHAALDYYYRSLSYYESLNDREGIANQKASIGVVLELMGQFELALNAYLEALDVQREQNDVRGISNSLFNIAEIYRELGNLDRALTFFNDALAIDKQLGLVRNIAYSHVKIGIVLRQQQRYADAKQHLNTAIQLFTELQAPRDKDWAIASLGEVMISEGKLAEGMSTLLDTLERSKQRNNLALTTDLRLAIARAAIISEDADLALYHADLGLEESNVRGELKRQAEFYSVRVAALRLKGQFEEALLAREQQLAIEQSILMQGREAALQSLQSEVEYARQEQSIETLRKDKAMELHLAEQRNIRNVSLLASLIVVLLLGFLLVSRQSHRLRSKELSDIVNRRTLELERKNSELQQAYRTLEQMSLRDPLTGCYNRHYLDANLPAEIQRCVHSYSSAIALGQSFPDDADLICFLIDIDDFKEINDTHGHVSGDKFLVKFAQIISQVFRHSDLQVRWGGEEFLVICRNTPRSEASLLAERLRMAVSESVFEAQDGTIYTATCSIGFSAFPLDQKDPEKASWDDIFNAADNCLYAAKYSGKDSWVGVLRVIDKHAQDEQNPLEQQLNIGRLELVTSLNNTASIQWQHRVTAT